MATNTEIKYMFKNSFYLVNVYAYTCAHVCASQCVYVCLSVCEDELNWVKRIKFLHNCQL